MNRDADSPLDRFTRPANYVHWSFDEEAGPAHAETSGLAQDSFIADRALTPPEIRHLMTHNKPATPETLAAQ